MSNLRTDLFGHPKLSASTFFKFFGYKSLKKKMSAAGLCTFLQEPVVGGVSGSSLERRLPVGTPGVVGLRFAKNGDEKRT